MYILDTDLMIIAPVNRKKEPEKMDAVTSSLKKALDDAQEIEEAVQERERLELDMQDRDRYSD